jgi:hypothetical protein
MGATEQLLKDKFKPERTILFSFVCHSARIPPDGTRDSTKRSAGLAEQVTWQK